MSILLVAAVLALTSHDHGHSGHDHHAAAEAQSVVAADVRTVDAAARTALLRHEAMAELSMPSMVMEFAIAEEVDIALFEPGAALMITVVNGEDGLEVIAAEPEHAGH
jgi:Cu(I)/Ag(I) efflux system membrane fusion protein